MRIGYMRVSTNDQDVELQKRALESAGCEKIFSDQKSGASIERSGLSEALKFSRAGDTLIVWRLDRLCRSLKNLIELINSLEQSQVGLKSLHETIDTTTANGKLIFQIFGALSEFERNLIKERTKAGQAAARARGRFGGRPSKLTKKQVQEMLTLHSKGKLSISQIVALYKITPPTFYRYYHAQNRNSEITH